MTIAARYAFRSLFRHRRRSLLSIAGTGIGCGVCLLLISFVKGEGEMMMRAAAESGAGHLQIVPGQWVKTRDMNLRLERWQTALHKTHNMDNVQAAAPYARAEALLAMGTRTAGVTVTGVAPEAEQKLNRLVRKVLHGSYLETGDREETVIGKVVADRLDVGIGDDLVVTASGIDGDMRSAMLNVKGIISTGSRRLDSSFCHVALADMENITGNAGAGGIALLLENPELMKHTQDRVSTGLPPGAEVITWKEIIPELASGVEIDETFTDIMVAVVIAVVFLGIASAQLAAALERRKEFAVISALGMQDSRLASVMILEGLILGVLGSVTAVVLGTPAVYFISVHGVDFTGMYGEGDLGISSVLIDPIIYGSFDWWILPTAFVLGLTATTLSSLYPALYARRTDPAEALRADN